MCLLIDRRENGIVEEVRRLGVEVVVTELEFGDCAFSGNGPDGECVVGCERKRLSDLVNSMKDRRLSGHQLRGLWKAYEFVFLFVEGVWRPGRGGAIEELRGRDWVPFYGKADRVAVSYQQVAAFMDSLSLRSVGPSGQPVRVVQTTNPAMTAARYVALYKGFTEKRWDQHHAHEQIYTAFTLPKKGHGGGWAHPHEHAERGPGGRATTVNGSGPAEPNTLWRMAAQLPGVDRRAQAVAGHFRTVRDMANATEKEWEEVPGIGKKTAEAAVRAITEEGA